MKILTLLICAFFALKSNICAAQSTQTTLDSSPSPMMPYRTITVTPSTMTSSTAQLVVTELDTISSTSTTFLSPTRSSKRILPPLSEYPVPSSGQQTTTASSSVLSHTHATLSVSSSLAAQQLRANTQQTQSVVIDINVNNIISGSSSSMMSSSSSTSIQTLDLTSGDETMPGQPIPVTSTGTEHSKKPTQSKIFNFDPNRVPVHPQPKWAERDVKHISQKTSSGFGIRSIIPRIPHISQSHAIQLLAEVNELREHVIDTHHLALPPVIPSDLKSSQFELKRQESSDMEQRTASRSGQIFRHPEPSHARVDPITRIPSLETQPVSPSMAKKACVVALGFILAGFVQGLHYLNDTNETNLQIASSSIAMPLLMLYGLYAGYFLSK